MALQGRVTTYAGVITPDQYIKIDSVRITKNDMCVSVGYHPDKQASDDGVPPYEVTDYSGPYDIDGDNPLQQGYELVKSLGYLDCEDV